MTDIYQLLERTAGSENAALLIALSIAVALAVGWWRRESMHSSRYDRLQADRTARENYLLECMDRKEKELEAFSREALEVNRNVVTALTGVEHTLDGLEALVRVVLNQRIHEKKGESGEQ